MKFIAIIPARYASTRFPGKPLANMDGKPMIQRVYEQVKRPLSDVHVATDDVRILEAVESFGGKAVMTSVDHRSGTDRCNEAYHKIGEQFDVVLNIQGDEPFIFPEQIDLLKACFSDDSVEIATLVKPFEVKGGIAALQNPQLRKWCYQKKRRLSTLADLLSLFCGMWKKISGEKNTYSINTLVFMDIEPMYCKR